MSNVVLNELPENWAWTKLGNVITKIIGGGTPSKSNKKYWDGEIPWLTIKDMRTRRPADTIDHITQEAVDESSTNLIPADTVIMATRVGLGKVVRVPYATTINQDLKALVSPPELNKSYLEYWLVSKAQHLKSIGSGTTVKGIRLEQVKELDFPLAPLEQQKRIVAKIEELFSHIDAGIEALNKAKKLLKQYRQSVLKAAVTGEHTKEWRAANADRLEPESQLLERILEERQAEYSRKMAVWKENLEKWEAADRCGKKPVKPQKPKSMAEPAGGLGSLPDGWSWLRLGSLAVDVFDGPFGSSLKSSDYVDNGVRVIRLENIGSLEFKNEKITYVSEDKYEVLKKHTVSSGDIVFSSFVADGTRVAVLPENIRRAINKADCFCVRAFGDSIDANYLANFLSTASAYKALESQVHGATRPRVNTTQLKELEIPICSVDEQREIVACVKEKFISIERLVKEVDCQMNAADKNKQSILDSAFSGGLL